MAPPSCCLTNRCPCCQRWRMLLACVLGLRSTVCHGRFWKGRKTPRAVLYHATSGVARRGTASSKFHIRPEPGRKAFSSHHEKEIASRNVTTNLDGSRRLSFLVPVGYGT